MHIHRVSYLEDISLLIMFTICAVAPVITGLQLMIKALISSPRIFLLFKHSPRQGNYIIRLRDSLNFGLNSSLNYSLSSSTNL